VYQVVLFHFQKADCTSETPVGQLALAAGIIQNMAIPKTAVNLRIKVFIKKGFNLVFPYTGKGHH